MAGLAGIYTVLWRQPAAARITRARVIVTTSVQALDFPRSPVHSCSAAGHTSPPGFATRGEWRMHGVGLPRISIGDVHHVVAEFDQLALGQGFGESVSDLSARRDEVQGDPVVAIFLPDKGNPEVEIFCPLLRPLVLHVAERARGVD